MKKEFKEIEAGSRLLLSLSSGNRSMEMTATLVRHLKENIALITLDTATNQVYKFDNISISIVYTNPEGIPFIWMNSTIVFYQGQYLLQVKADGGQPHMRRNCYRVGVSQYAKLQIPENGTLDVIVRDVSLTGFSITSRQKDLPLENGTRCILFYEDAGHILNLEGNVVRIEETEQYTIYGFVITKSCKELSAYVNMKQKQKRN